MQGSRALDIRTERDLAHYKVVFTLADFGAGAERENGGIIAQAANKTALIEVHVNIEMGRVEDTFPAPPDPIYHGIQVTIF